MQRYVDSFAHFFVSLIVLRIVALGKFALSTIQQSTVGLLSTVQYSTCTIHFVWSFFPVLVYLLVCFLDQGKVL